MNSSLLFLAILISGCSPPYVNRGYSPYEIKNLKQKNEELMKSGDLRSKNREQQHQQEGLTTDKLKADLKDIINNKHHKNNSSASLHSSSDSEIPMKSTSLDEGLESAKLDCAQLFKKGTKDYGNCVLELLD